MQLKVIPVKLCDSFSKSFAFTFAHIDISILKMDQTVTYCYRRSVRACESATENYDQLLQLPSTVEHVVTIVTLCPAVETSY